MIQEGVTFSLGMLTSGGDAQRISALGIPPFILIVIGAIFLIPGLGLISSLLPIAEIKPEDSFAEKLITVLIGMCLLMVIRFTHAFWLAPENLLENLIPLVFSIILAVVVAAFYRPLNGMVKNHISVESTPITWSASILALILGAGIFVFQIYI